MLNKKEVYVGIRLPKSTDDIYTFSTGEPAPVYDICVYVSSVDAIEMHYLIINVSKSI